MVINSDLVYVIISEEIVPYPIIILESVMEDEIGLRSQLLEPHAHLSVETFENCHV